MNWNRADDEGHRLIDRFTDWCKSRSKQTLPEYLEGDQLHDAFNESMKHEIDENFYKGDRENWINLSKDEALNEIDYHVEKLKTAIDMHDEERIKENTADIANCCLIFLDVMGYIEPKPIPAPEPPTKVRNYSDDYSYGGS